MKVIQFFGCVFFWDFYLLEGYGFFQHKILQAGDNFKDFYQAKESKDNIKTILYVEFESQKSIKKLAPVKKHFANEVKVSLCRIILFIEDVNYILIGYFIIEVFLNLAKLGGIVETLKLSLSEEALASANIERSNGGFCVGDPPKCLPRNGLNFFVSYDIF